MIHKIVELEKDQLGKSLGIEFYENMKPKIISIQKGYELIGFISYMEHEKYYDVLNIVVDKKYQEQGYAHRLMSKMPDDRRIVLEVRESNVVARNLYEKHGFIKTGVKKNYYKTEDGIVYEKNQIRIHAHGKTNYILSVGNQKQDGLHEVSFLMDKVNLYDDIYIIPSEKFDIISDFKFGIPIEENIMYKAYLEMKKEVKSDLEMENIKIYIKKQIPMAAGMGGGSSDAAAVIKGLNQLWNLNLSKEKMIEIAFKLGSDVPFFIVEKLAIVEGFGEIVKPLNIEFPKTNMLIVANPKKLSTKDVFSKFDELILNPHENIKAFEKIDQEYIEKIIRDENWDEIYKMMDNNLETASFRVLPGLETLKINLEKLNPEKVLMSGSGPTMIVFDKNIEKLNQIKNKYCLNYTTWLIKN